MALIQNPLIPAKAGTQLAGSEAVSTNSAPFQPALALGDLGPGLRRDERLF
jgi:hypothetical protein